MSKFRGAFPLLLATVLGVGNGLWVFGPAFKEQQQEKEEKDKQLAEVRQAEQDGTLETLRRAEADASRSHATDAALRSETSSKSLWGGLGLWARGKPTVENTTPLSETPTTSEKEGKGESPNS